MQVRGTDGQSVTGGSRLVTGTVAADPEKQKRVAQVTETARNAVGGNTGYRSGGSGGSGGVAAPVVSSGFDYGAALEEARQRREAQARELQQSMYAQADSQYEFGASNLNKSSNKALQENYLAKMLTQRNLGQNLAAAGKSGGASETTMLGIENNYGKARGDVEEARLEGLAQLEQQRAAAKAQADQAIIGYLLNDGQSYNTLLAQAAANASNNGTQGIIDSYNAAMENATAAQRAANAVTSGSGNTGVSKTGNPAARIGAMSTAIANWRNAPSDQFRSTDAYRKNIASYLSSQGYSAAEIAAYFNANP